MSNSKPYLILAYYHFTTFADPYNEVRKHKDFFKKKDATCRIYISQQGINGQMSAAYEDAHAYINWIESRAEFQGISFKIDGHHEHVFPRLTIKYRPHLVGFDKEVNLEKRGEHVTPLLWKEMLEKNDDHILLDVRNDYEWKIGHFENAQLPPCETFRDFDSYAEKLKETKDPKNTPVMMYCTGGIRCELYSSILKEKGFEKVYQLDGGIINYGKKVGNSHWLGKLFVFDDRLSVPISEEQAPVIGACHHCNNPSDAYYNCANMDCNELFLCCPTCLEANEGCCKELCQTSTRLRPYHRQNLHKPFRRWHQYFTKKT
jgi:UPF0176 protein